VILRELGRDTPLQAVNGHCLRCSYRLVWIVIKGKESPLARKRRRFLPLVTPMIS